MELKKLQLQEGVIGTVKIPLVQQGLMAEHEPGLKFLTSPCRGLKINDLLIFPYPEVLFKS